MNARDISLCVIYRDEERLLPSFLDHHADLFGELIMVDTGSRDRSNEWIRSRKLPVHSFPWTGHFSEARNFSLDRATRPWICVLDVDEVLLPEDLDRIVAELNQGDVDGLSLCQINLGHHPDNSEWFASDTLPHPFCDMASGYTISRLIRIFRNDRRVRFQGAIHEVIGHSLHAAGLHSRISQIPIYHIGWTEFARNKSQQEEKVARYEDIIRRAYSEDPSVQNGYYMLTIAADPGERLRLAYTLSRRYPDILDFVIVMARSAGVLGQWSRALSYIRNGLERFPQSESLRLLELVALNQEGDPELALELQNSLPTTLSSRCEFRVERIKSLVLTGRKEEARKELDRQSPPLSPEILQGLQAYFSEK